MAYQWLIGLQISLIFFNCLCIAKDWSYTNDRTSPETWPEHYKDMCSGYYQSPIDLKRSISVLDSKLKTVLIYRNSSSNTRTTLENNGHSVRIKFPNNTWFISFDGLYDNKYEIVELHFHWGSTNDHGSEHTIDGHRFPLEGHIVSYRKEMYPSVNEAVGRPGGLAVLGIMHHIVESATYENTVFRAYRNFSGLLNSQLVPSTILTVDEFNLTAILDFLNPDRYFRYFGSLTTPPCTENVLWTVFTDPVPITLEQMKLFRTLLYASHENQTIMTNNFRPLQLLNPSNTLAPRVLYRAKASSLSLLSLPTLLCIMLFGQFTVIFY